MKITPVKKEKGNISSEVFTEMKKKIINGEWKPGTKIPSENELTKIFNVSRVTVRESLKKLNSYNIITAKQGSGTYVNKAESNVLFNPMMSVYIKNMDETSIRDMMEFRGIFEKESAYLAALRGTEEDIKQLEKLYDNMIKNRDNIKDFSKYDLEFHRYLSVMMRNSILIAAGALIWDFMEEHFHAVVKKAGVEKGIYSHGEIIKALRDKDPERARYVMSEHIKAVNKEYFDK